MTRAPALSQIALLLTVYRIFALLLYRPGGLLEPTTRSPYYFLLNISPTLPPFAAPIVGGLLMIPLELLTIYLIARLTRAAGQPDAADERALWWAISPLSLWAFLTGPAPLYCAIMLLGLRWLRQGRRTWLLIALIIAVAAIMAGGNTVYPSLLLLFIILLVPDPAPLSLLFAAGVLLAGPFAAIVEAEGVVLAGLQALLWVGAIPASIELGLMVFPVPGWERWRALTWRGASALFTALTVIVLFVLLPPQVRAARINDSPLAPALAEMASAPTGWLVTDDHDQWERAVGLGVGDLKTRVMTSRNVDDLHEMLMREPTSLWLLESGRADSTLLKDTLTADFYVADAVPLLDGTRLHRYATSAPNAESFTLDARFEDGITLSHARIPTVIRAGLLLPVELYWQGESGDMKLFLHLLRGDGTRIAQRDALPGSTPDRHALLVPATAEAGHYTIVAGRYHPDTLERVALSQGGDTIIVTTIEVTP